MQKLITTASARAARYIAVGLLLLIVSLGLLDIVPVASTVFGQGQSVLDGINSTTNETITAGEAETGVNSLVASAIDIFSWVVGVISVIMIIVGGLKYITAAGDSNSVSSAKNTILYAIVGLVVVAFAQIIVIFVLSEVGVTPPAPAPDPDESTMVQQIVA